MLQNGIRQYAEDHPDHEGPIMDIYQKHIINTIHRTTRGLTPLLDYFLSDGFDDTSLHYYRNMVEELAFVDIWADKTGGRPLFFNDMFGLSINDLYKLDFATFNRYYDRALKMKERFIEISKEQAEELERLNADAAKRVWR